MRRTQMLRYPRCKAEQRNEINPNRVLLQSRLSGTISASSLFPLMLLGLVKNDLTSGYYQVVHGTLRLLSVNLFDKIWTRN